jgi:cytochrome c-type biogenesis protein CcmH/NrfG
MSEPASDHSPLRAFVRGAWTLIVVQLVVALVVFGALSYASVQLNRILRETAHKQAELDKLRTDVQTQQRSIAEARATLQKARDATPIVRHAIISFHNRRYADAIEQYKQALELDPANSWVRDLMSYSQYMAGRDAQRAGEPEKSRRLFDDAVTSIRQVLQEIPEYIGGYVELAIYECARDRADAAVSAYEAAVARTVAARGEFAFRLDEIPQRCTALRSRIVAK